MGVLLSRIIKQKQETKKHNNGCQFCRIVFGVEFLGTFMVVNIPRERYMIS